VSSREHGAVDATHLTRMTIEEPQVPGAGAPAAQMVDGRAMTVGAVVPEAGSSRRAQPPPQSRPKAVTRASQSRSSHVVGCTPKEGTDMRFNTTWKFSTLSGLSWRRWPA